MANRSNSEITNNKYLLTAKFEMHVVSYKKFASEWKKNEKETFLMVRGSQQFKFFLLALGIIKCQLHLACKRLRCIKFIRIKGRELILFAKLFLSYQICKSIRLTFDSRFTQIGAIIFVCISHLQKQFTCNNFREWKHIMHKYHMNEWEW